MKAFVADYPLSAGTNEISDQDISVEQWPNDVLFDNSLLYIKKHFNPVEKMSALEEDGRGFCRELLRCSIM